MAVHATVLTWRIPRTEEPGGLSSSRGHKELDANEETEHARNHIK